MRTLALMILLLVSPQVFAGERGGISVLDRMLAAREAGKIDAPDYYSATSADVQAYYLMAYAWDRSLPLDHRRREAARLMAELETKTNRNGPCRGWGLGVALDAFGDGSINPADAIYLYTSARVVRALVEAERAGLTNGIPDEHFREAACSFKTLFKFDPKLPRLQYSDQENDAGYLVYNVFADLVIAATDLATRTGDDDLRRMAHAACSILTERTAEDGYLPYFEGRNSTDPTHHAMVLNGLIRCTARFSDEKTAKAAAAATDYLRRTYFSEGAFTPGKHDPEWAAGEALIALTDLCETASQYCELKESVLRYVAQHESGGAVNNRAARFQSWLAAGLAYAKRFQK